MPITFVGEHTRDTGIQEVPGPLSEVVTLHTSTISVEVGQVLVVWGTPTQGWSLSNGVETKLFSPAGGGAGFLAYLYINEAWAGATLKCELELSPGSWSWGFVVGQFAGFENVVDQGTAQDLLRARNQSNSSTFSDNTGSPASTVDPFELVLGVVYVAPYHPDFNVPPTNDATDVPVTQDLADWVPLDPITLTSGFFTPVFIDPYQVHYTLAPFYIITGTVGTYENEGTLPNNYDWTTNTLSLRKLAEFGPPDVFPDPPPPPPSQWSYAVSIAATYQGKHICYRSGPNILVYSTFDEGASWIVSQVAADAGGNAVPVIAVDWTGLRLFVAYHTDANVVRVHMSESWGAAWALWRVVTGARWPRLCMGKQRQFLVVWSTTDSRIELFDSDDSLATIGPAVTTLTVYEQLVDFLIDRKGSRHLFYGSTPNVYQRVSRGGGDYTTTILLGTGQRITAGFYRQSGVVWYWDNTISTLLYGRSLTADYLNPSSDPIIMTTGMARQYIGFTVDRRNLPWVVWIVVPEPAPVPPAYPGLYYAPGQPVNSPGEPPGMFTADPADLPELGFGAEEIPDPPPRLDAIETPPGP